MSHAQIWRCLAVTVLAVPAAAAAELVGGVLVVVPFLAWLGYWPVRKNLIVRLGSS